MKKVSRRKFLKGAALTGILMGLPTLVPAQVVAGKGVKRVMPNDRVNIGQIGCGGIANYYHSNALKRMEDVRVVAACDAYRSRREALATLYNQHYGGSEVTKTHSDFREVLARPDVDAVIIAAHDNWHTPMSIAAANAGKDVFCQKPLALDFSLAKILRKVINDKRRIFQFGTQYRSMGPKGRYRQMVQLVRNGYIGKLQRIDLWCRDMSFDVDQYNVKPYGSTVEIPVPEGFDFDAWMGPSEMVPYTSDRATCWGGFHCPETSLGFIAGCGIHELGLAQWANKTDHTSPIRYTGTGTVPDEGIFRTLARWDVTCDYANGVKLRFMDCRTAKASLAASLPRAWQDGDGVIFHGSEGWISDAMGFCASDQALWKANFKSSDEELPVSIEHNRNFIDCVKSRQETICPVEMGIRCDTICHLARAAALTGKVVKWDPKKEEIVGDNPEASKLLSLPYREKWKVW